MSTTTSKKGAAARKTSTKKVKPGSKANDSRLQKFFHDEIKDIYWAEKKLVTTLPKMAKAATSEELQDAFTEHLEVTKNHVTRLETVFELLGQQPQAKKCEAMEGITKEGESIIQDTEDGTHTRDVALILAGQKAEHYEIATYGGLAQVATSLGYGKIAELLFATLEEEKETDANLTTLAENSVNGDATEE